MKQTFKMLLAFTLLLFSVLWLSSYTHHTAIGIDHDQVLDDHYIVKWFHRITWNGHGSLWVGYGTTKPIRNTGQTLERYDPASVLFQPSRPVNAEQSFWNRLGFWYISTSQPRKMFWLGVPAWLPVLLLGLLIFQLQRRQTASSALKRNG